MPNDLEAIKRAFEDLLGNRLSIYGIAENFDWKNSYEKLTKILMKSKDSEEALKKLIALAKKEEAMFEMIDSILEDLFDTEDLKELQAVIKKHEVILGEDGKTKTKKDGTQKAKKTGKKKAVARKASSVKATKKKQKKAAKKKARTKRKKADNKK